MADLKLQPFELSLWKDKVFTEEPEYSAEEDLKYKNVYRGLGTDEKDLSFWFLPRKWNGAKFIPDEDDPINKVIVDIAPPQERTTSLVHADFSTSCLDFKPNTYYTFLLHLDFTVEGARLPDWSTYVAKKANVNKDNHYLISFIRKKIESSMWHMPPSIFNSSIAISFDEDGFNLENSELNEDYEDMRLFIHKDSDVVDHVLLLCSVKTNDFLTENNTLGLWSFFEAWADDYWKAGMEIYGFEDNLTRDNNDRIVLEKLKIFYELLANENPLDIVHQYEPYNFSQELMGPINDELDVSSNPITWELLKREINKNTSLERQNLNDKIVKAIKNEIYLYYYNIFKLFTENSLNLDDEEFLKNYGVYDEEDNTYKLAEDNPSLNYSSLQAGSKNVAEIYYSYFSGLAFPYIQFENGQIETKYYNAFSEQGSIYEFLHDFGDLDKFLLDNHYLLPIVMIGDNNNKTPYFYLEGSGSNPDQYYSFTSFFNIKQQQDLFIIDEQRLDKVVEIITNAYFSEIYLELDPDPQNDPFSSSITIEGELPITQTILDYLKYTYFSYNGSINNISQFLYEESEEEKFITKDGTQILIWLGHTLNFIPQFNKIIEKMKKIYIDKIYDDVLIEEGGTSKIRGDTYEVFSFFIVGLFIFFLEEGRINWSGNFNQWGINNSADKLYIEHFYQEAKSEVTRYFTRFITHKTYYNKFSEKFLYEVHTQESLFNYYIGNCFSNSSTLLLGSIEDIIENSCHKKYSKQYIKECKQLVFGNQEGHPSYAQNISFVEGTKDALHTLTFSLYNYYYNEYGKKERNYFIDLLHEEDKIKLKYDNKWYDFIITDTNKDTVEHKVDYTAKDANVIELSKIGFNKTFNSELDNNVGTISELATLALQDTNWKLNELEQDKHKFHQGVLKPVIKGVLKQDVDIILKSYYYNRNLEKEELENEIELQEGDTIYVFIDDFKKNSEEDEELSFKIICAEDFGNSFEIINNQLINVCLYPVFSVYQQGEEKEIETVPYYLQELSTYITLPDIFQNESPNELIFDYTLRGEDIVTKPYTHYSVPLKRYVMEYKDLEEDKVLYGYVKSEYTTTPLVQNLIPNGEDFTSTDGWITGTTNYYTNLSSNIGAFTTNNDISTITPYIQFYSYICAAYTGCHGIACNTELGYNFAGIKNIMPGDEFVLRVQLERGGNITQVSGSNDREILDKLSLMSSMKPYIYEYDSVLSLQSKGVQKALPLKEQQVLNFIQDARYIERAKINSGLLSVEDNPYETSVDNRSVFDTYTFNLKDVLDIDEFKFISYSGVENAPQGLVPIYWANAIYAGYDTKPSKDDYDYAVYHPFPGAHNGYYYYQVSNINNVPVAYITEKLAKKWSLYENDGTLSNSEVDVSKFSDRGTRKKYLVPFKGTDVLAKKGTQNLKYYFSVNGWDEFRKLFVNIGTSNMRLRDFAIIGNIDANKCEYSNTETNPPNSSTYPSNMYPNAVNSLKYYLPMLFTTTELLHEVEQYIEDNETPNSNNVTIDEQYINKNFFKMQLDFPSCDWTAFLEQKEYYELSKQRGQGHESFSVEPHIPDNGRTINITDIDNNIPYHDYDLLMRMRMHWFPLQYSREGSCIFEAIGTYYGKPIKVNNDYEFKNGAIGPLEYTHEDLLTKNLGLFFIFGENYYDGATGHGITDSISLSKIQLFRRYLDKDGNTLLPNKVLESNTTPIYYLYDKEENLDVLKEEDMKYQYIGSYIPEDKYELNIDLSGEKKNSITITESNVYNILQKLAEIFDAYLVIEVNHNENGEILEREDSENHELDKNIYFVDSNYIDNFSGIKYGINLQKITRKIDSNDLITKLIVKNNSNEFGKNGFCSIARSKYNLSGSNAIFNLDYLITMGIITPELKEKLYQKIYPRTRAYGRFLDELIDHRAKQSIIASQTKAEADFNKLILNEAKEKMNQSIDEYNSLTNIRKNIDGKVIEQVGIGYYINNEIAKNKLPSEAQKIINTAIFYMNLVTGYNAKYKNSLIAYEDAERDYKTSKDITESITVQRDSLLNEFQLLAGGRIKEGAWSSEDYIDDDLYYLDGERQLRETSVPKVSYTIEIADISSLPGYEGYKFNLRDKTTIEDPEMFGYDSNGTPNKEEIIISEKTSYLQSPDKNTITVQNYKTKFEDLFQRMASTIKAVEFGTLNYTNKNSTNSIENRVESNETDLRAIKIYNNL